MTIDYFFLSSSNTARHLSTELALIQFQHLTQGHEPIHCVVHAVCTYSLNKPEIAYITTSYSPVHQQIALF